MEEKTSKKIENDLLELAEDTSIQIKKEHYHMRSLFSQEILTDLAKLIPTVSFIEIMGYENYEQKGADKIVYNIGKIFSKLDNPQELNVAMQILSTLAPCSIKNNGLTLENIYQEYCKNYNKISSKEFQTILKKITGQSSFSPIQDTYQGFKMSEFGAFIYEYYRKLKAEMLVFQKYGKFKELVSFFMGFRTLMNYDIFNMDVNPIYVLVRSLHNTIKILREQGDQLFMDEMFTEKIIAIHNLIDQLLHLQETFMQNSNFNIQDHAQLLGKLAFSVADILNLYTKKFDLSFTNFFYDKVNNPAPLLERFILEQWDNKDWTQLFCSSMDTSLPSQILIPFSENILEKAITQYLVSSPIEYIEDLPEGELNDILKLSVDELRIRKQESQRIKNQIWDKILSDNYNLDYDVFKDIDVLHFFKKMNSFYSLAFEKRLHIQDQIKEIADPEYKIKFFTARPFKITKEKGGSKIL